MAPFAWLTGIAVAILLAAEWRSSRIGVWLAKPLAAAGFLGAALALGALGSSYGRWLLAGLSLSFLGDVLLIPRGARATFGLGLGSFLLAHVAFSAAFAIRGLDAAIGALAALAGLMAAVGALRWLDPLVPSALRLPVRVYVIVILAMLACAAAAVPVTGDPRIVLGAALFAISDLAVARERFVAPALANKLWGLPLYFAGQLTLASTVAL